MDTGLPEVQVRLFENLKILVAGIARPLPASSHACSLLAPDGFETGVRQLPRQ